MGQLEMEMCPSERCPSAPLHTNTVTSDRGVTSLLEINTRTAALYHRPAIGGITLTLHHQPASGFHSEE